MTLPGHPFAPFNLKVRKCWTVGLGTNDKVGESPGVAYSFRLGIRTGINYEQAGSRIEDAFQVAFQTVARAVVLLPATTVLPAVRCVRVWAGAIIGADNIFVDPVAKIAPVGVSFRQLQLRWKRLR